MNSATVASSATDDWLALVIGNTRLHWGAFRAGQLASVWHTPHLARDWVARIQSSGFDAEVWKRVPGLSYSAVPKDLAPKDLAPKDLQSLHQPQSLWLASVVPEQTALWANRRAADSDERQRASTYVVERSQIPLQNIYPTLGIDRAINLLGAGHTVGWPVLVVDAGTALTFTAGVAQSVVGGAILPGMQMQAQGLSQRTAALPAEANWLSGQNFSNTAWPQKLPNRWAMTTPDAIASGLIYGTLSSLQDYLSDWWQQYPEGKAVLTGGDGLALQALWQQKTPEMASRVSVDSHLMFAGMQRYRSGAMLLL